MTTVNRSKQQALAFLLGALLVGAVLGFNLDRVVGDEHQDRRPRSRSEARARMYDDLQLSREQRFTMDSVLDMNRREMQEIMKVVRPRLDSLREATNAKMLEIMTPEQRTRFEERSRRQKEEREKR